MSEGPPKPEPAPGLGVDAFEALVQRGVWNKGTEAELEALLEKHEEDFYMLYVNYTESGLVDDLSDHERQLYDWLAKQFGE